MSDKDLLADAKESFRRKEEAETKIRQAWLDDFRFARLGEQWPYEVKRDRERDRRPCLTINRLPSFIRQVTNDARQNRPAIKVHPVGDGAAEEAAEIFNGLIRNIEYSSDADVAYDTALDHAVTGGFGYFRISTDYACEDVFDQDIKIERIVNPLSVYGDEKSTAADSSDWNEAFVTQLYTVDEFEREFGKSAQKSDFQSDSKDRDQQWFTDDHVRVAEWWTREDEPVKLLKLSDGMVLFEDKYLELKEILDALGLQVVQERMSTRKKVRQRIITGAEILEEKKWEGRYIPIIPVYGDEVNVEGQRSFISLVRFAKDPQQMFNYWRTASTELVALAPKAPFVGPRGFANSSPEKWATANTISHAYLEYDGPTPPQRQTFDGPPAGALQEALNASDDMKSIMGIFDASLGARSNETSGKAIMARQREGDTATFNYIDNLSRAIRHAGRVIVDLIPHVYNTERIIRVIHEDGSNERVQIAPTGQPAPPQQENEQVEQMQGMAKVYDLTVGKYDVTCEAGPSYNTKREEASEQMMGFLQSFPQAAPLIGDLVAKNLDWPGADDIADRLKLMLPPQAQGQNPQVMQLQQQLQMAEEAINVLKSKLQDKGSKDAYEAQKMRNEAFDAVTRRIDVLEKALQGRAQIATEATAQLAQMPGLVLPASDPMGVPNANQPPPMQQPQQQPPSGGFSLPQ